MSNRRTRTPTRVTVTAWRLWRVTPLDPSVAASPFPLRRPGHPPGNLAWTRGRARAACYAPAQPTPHDLGPAPGCSCGIYACDLADLLPFAQTWIDTREPDVVIGLVRLAGPLVRGPVDPRDPATVVRGRTAHIGPRIYWPTGTVVGPGRFARAHPHIDVRVVPDLTADTLREAGETL